MRVDRESASGLMAARLYEGANLLDPSLTVSQVGTNNQSTGLLGPPVSGLLSNADILQRVLLQTTEEVSDKDDVFAAASSEPMLSDSELRQMFHALHQGLIARESDQAIVEHVEKAMLFSRQAAVMKGQAKKSD